MAGYWNQLDAFQNYRFQSRALHSPFSKSTKHPESDTLGMHSGIPIFKKQSDCCKTSSPALTSIAKVSEVFVNKSGSRESLERARKGTALVV
jgi:hypothetical protein